MVGSILSAVNNIKQGYWQNAFNMVNAVQSIKQARLQREAFEYQKYFDANQTQIRVDDMAKAGLNPILASGAAGASSVSGVSAQPVNANVDGGQLDKLADLLDNEEQRKADASLAADKNETDKDIAEINAQTQLAVAAANITAQEDLRGSQARLNNANAVEQERKTEFNSDNSLYDGDNPNTVFGFLHSVGRRIAEIKMKNDAKKEEKKNEKKKKENSKPAQKPKQWTSARDR